MALHRYDATVTTLYAELLDQLLALEGQRSIANLRGGFASKTLNARRYWYFQYRDINQRVRQVYIGPDNDTARRFVERFGDKREQVVPDERQIERLCGMLRQGGMRPADAGVFRILRALADGGLFRQGAVLVGTHAFVAIGGLLGVRWANPSMQTQDIDVARDNSVDLALPPRESIDLPAVLESLEMGFLPVPALNPRSPSTSFKIRGRDLRLDLLTPSKTTRSKPVYFDAIKAAAQPLRFLDYLMERPERAAFIGRSALLVNIPDPARFALHKLVVSRMRPAAFQAKASKDREQAARLLEDRRFDVESAWEAIQDRGERWARLVLSELNPLEKSHPEVAALAREVIR